MSRFRVWLERAWLAALIALWVVDRYEVRRRMRFWERRG